MQTIRELLTNYGNKFKIDAVGENDTSFERFTLDKIPKYINNNSKFLYIHTKGVSAKHSSTDNVYWWRTWMEYHLIYRFKECLAALDKFNIVGVGYTKKVIGPHFSGNFWWTKGSYFNTLPKKPDGSLNIGPAYTDPESFIFKGKDPMHLDIDEGRAENPDIDYFTMKPGIRAANKPAKPVKKGGRRKTQTNTTTRKRGGSITTKSVDLIVSRYNEKLLWLDTYKENGLRYIQIYNKSTKPIECPKIENSTTQCKVHTIPNVGVCDHTYLYHIVHNYDTLADVTIFTPGSGDNDYKKDILDFTIKKALETKNTVMNVYTFDVGVGEAMYKFTMPKYSLGMKNNFNGDVREDPQELATVRPFGEWYSKNIPGEQTKHGSFFGIMAISKEHIHRRTKSFYEGLLQQVNTHKFHEASHFMERSWSGIVHPLTPECLHTHPAFKDRIGVHHKAYSDLRR